MAAQRWRSLGHVLVAAGETALHATHASYPTPLILLDGTVRVFYSPRDTSGRSSIWSIDLAVSTGGFEKLGAPFGPWLETGPPGAFDDAGASVSWAGWREDGGIDLWYLGWSRGVSVPFRTAIGRAGCMASAPRLERTSFAPALDRNATDPLSLGYPWLLSTADGLNIWYGAHRHPPRGERTVDHAIRRATSTDGGVTWARDQTPAIDLATPDEWALSRPSILRDASGWRMWYCRRRETYALGYAQSDDGLTWKRDDAAMCFVTPEADWEAGSRTYPAVFSHQGRRWMLYNGVGYGRTGFGLAIAEDD